MSEAHLNIGAWDVESLRVTIFPPAGFWSADQQIALWEEVTGQPPESINSNPQQGLTYAVGRVRGNQFILGVQEVQVERVDWHVQPLAPQNALLEGIPTVADPQGMLKTIHDGLQHSLGTIKVVTRLAFGLGLVREVADVPAGMQQISPYLHNVTVCPSESTDFVYQINRRRNSTSVPHAEINRLGKWSVEEISSIALRMGPGQSPIRQDKEYYVRKLVTDINTTPDTDALSNDRVHDLFHEMVDISNELATKGDVP